MTAKIVNWTFVCLLIALIIADQWLPVNGWIYVGLTLVYFIIQVYGSSVLSCSYYLPVISKGGEGSKDVAITFDDGPVAGRTDKILDVLHEHNAPAAFFCIGKRVDAHPQLVRRMHEAGHLIANHSYFHGATFDLQWPASIYAELEATDKAIARAVGSRPALFRPPYGVTNPMVASAVRRGQYTTVGWSVRSFDTVISDRARLLRRITRSINGGDIILLHDHGKHTADILAELLNHISSLGLKIVRVDQLINKDAYVQA